MLTDEWRRSRLESSKGVRDAVLPLRGKSEGRSCGGARDASDHQGVVERDTAAERMGVGGAVAQGRPGYDVSAMVRARARFHAEV